MNLVPPFSVFESAKAAVTTVVHQNFHGIVYEATPQAVARHQTTAEALRKAAATEADSQQLIAATIEGMASAAQSALSSAVQKSDHAELPVNAYFRR